MGSESMLQYDSSQMGGAEGYALFCARRYYPHEDSLIYSTDDELPTVHEHVGEPLEEDDVSMMSVAGRPATPDPRRGTTRKLSESQMEFWGVTNNLADTMKTVQLGANPLVSGVEINKTTWVNNVLLGNTFSEEDQGIVNSLLENLYVPESVLSAMIFCFH